MNSKHPLETAQDLSKIIKQELEDNGLYEGEVTLEVDTEEYENFTDIEYRIETKEFVEEYDSKSIRIEDAYPVVRDVPLNSDAMRENLRDNFSDTETSLNGEIINYSPSANTFILTEETK